MEQARTIVVTHGVQILRNCRSVFMCSLFLRGKSPRRDGWQSTSGSTRRGESLRGIENKIDSQLHKSVLIANGESTRSSTSPRLRDITDLPFQLSPPSGGRTAFRDRRRAPATAVVPTFHTNRPGGYAIRKRQQQEKKSRINCD
jgi:hypothetical protein